MSEALLVAEDERTSPSDGLQHSEGDDLPQYTSTSFDDFVAGRMPRLLALAAGIVHRRDVAEELVQDSLAATLSRWGELETDDDRGAWLHRVIVNRCYSWHRRRLAEVRALVRVGTGRPNSSDHDRTAFEDVRSAIRRLPREQATAVCLYYFADLRMADVARAMEIPEGTAKSHLARARERLRLDLESHRR
jgi:RNA polymerase sigma factor (sigma-70 family)